MFVNIEILEKQKVKLRFQDLNVEFWTKYANEYIHNLEIEIQPKPFQINE